MNRPQEPGHRNGSAGRPDPAPWRSVRVNADRAWRRCRAAAPAHRALTRPGGQTRIRNGLSVAGCPRPQTGAETITLPGPDRAAGFAGTLKDPGQVDRQAAGDLPSFMTGLLAYDQETGTVHSRPGRFLVPATFYAAYADGGTVSARRPPQSGRLKPAWCPPGR